MDIVNRLYSVLDDIGKSKYIGNKQIDRSRNVTALKMRHGLHPYNMPMKWREIGEPLGVTTERARQIELKGERLLGHAVREYQIFKI